MADKKTTTVKTEIFVGNGLQTITDERLKTIYICEGLSPEQIAEKYQLPVAYIEHFAQVNKLDELRKAHIKHGLEKLQNTQIAQAQQLMDIESTFKRLRIIQLESALQDYVAYYSRHGHLYKVHPISGETLKDTNGIPLQIPLPAVTKELFALKESVQMSEGLKNLLGTIDAILNKPKDLANIKDPAVIDLEDYDNMFKKRDRDED